MNISQVFESWTAVSLYNPLIRMYGSGLLLYSGTGTGTRLPVANNTTIFSHAQQVEHNSRRHNRVKLSEQGIRKLSYNTHFTMLEGTAITFHRTLSSLQ
jgi:hypothetical protein